MRADQLGSPSETPSRRGGEGGTLRHTVPLALEALAAPRMRVDPSALMELLREQAYQPPDPVGETLNTLRRDLLSLVDAHTRGQRNFGLGLRPAEPLDISELRDRTHRSLTRLEGLYESGGDGIQLSHAHRDIILQANTVLREFLISLSDITSDGTLNRSDTSGFLRQCVALGQILGQMSLALDSQRSGQERDRGGSELPLEVVEALAARLQSRADG